MAGGRPPRSIEELNSQLGELGEELNKNPDVIEKRHPVVEKKKKVPTEYKFQMVGDFPVDKGNGTTRYPNLNLSHQQMVWDEQTGTSRQARLLNGVNTIWQDEQDKVTEKYAARNAATLAFTNGIMIVPAIDHLRVKYLMLCSDFEGCEKPVQNRKPRYKLLDTEKMEAKEFERKQLQRDAVNLAWKANMEDLVVHFKYMGGSMINNENETKSPEGLRADYVKLAEERYDYFLKTISNPAIKMHSLVQDAFSAAKIIYVDGQCMWGDTKKFICQVPLSYRERVADYLAELMLTGEGKELRARLENS